MLRWFSVLCLTLCLSSGARAQGLPDCGFGFEIDAQSSAFQSMVVDGEQKRGFWLSINRAPGDVRRFARHVGRLQTCLVTADGKPRQITRGGQTFTLDSPFLSNCTAALLPDNRLLTNVHCYFDPDLVRAGFDIVREARINFNYTSRDDTGAVRTYLVSPRELKMDKSLDAMVLQIIGGDANGDLGGHIPMKMMPEVAAFQELRMIHHPGADPQQYSTGTCQVHRRQSEIPPERSPFRHSCESTGGSSGSLLLDSRTLAVVALHNQGGLRPTGDSFNGGHKIALINRSLDLGFEEIAPTPGGENDAANRALTDALLTFDPAAKAEALRAVIARFPGTEAAQNAQIALDRTRGNDGDARESAAAQALSDALLTADLRTRVEALRGVIGRFSGTDAAEKARSAAARLETDLADRDRDAEARARFDRARATGDLERLRELLSDFDGTPFGFEVQFALLQAETAQRAAESAAKTALTDALLLPDRAARMAALAGVIRNHADQPAAQQAALALERLRAEPTPTDPEPTDTAGATPPPDPAPVFTPLRPVTESAIAEMLDGAGPTQADVIARGRLACGVSVGLSGFADTDDRGRWQGFDVDFCRAVAAAVLDDPDAVDFVPLNARIRFTALASGEIDLLVRNTTWTFARDADLGMGFAGVSLYDGQAIMVSRDLGVTSALHLDGAIVCTQTGTSTELVLADYFRNNGMFYAPLPAKSNAEAQQLYLSGACDAITTDRTALAVTRSSFPRPGNHVILPEILSREPLGPVVRDGDQDWHRIVADVLNGLKRAEDLGISSDTVDSFARGPFARLALDGAGVNLIDDSLLRAVKAVGNYGEIYARHLGPDTPIGLERGLNQTWRKGGLHYGTPALDPDSLPTAAPRRGTGDRLNAIRRNGQLRCGVDQDGIAPFSYTDAGTRAGLGPDICRAIAAAIFGDPGRVSYVEGYDGDWPGWLASGRIDIAPTPFVYSDAGAHDPRVATTVPVFFSGLGLAAPRSTGLRRLRELENSHVCLWLGSMDSMEFRHFADRSGLAFDPVQMTVQLRYRDATSLKDRCDVFAYDTASILRDLFHSASVMQSYDLLNDRVTVRPVTPYVPAGDDAFRDLVNWTIHALIAAEELGVTRDTVKRQAADRTAHPERDRLLGLEANLGAALGLGSDWAVQAIAAVGNYGEIHDRHLGPQTGLTGGRGPNALWRDGGLMYAPPFR